MSALKNALVAAAVADATLAGLIATRVHPLGKVPRSVAPGLTRMTYKRVTTDRPETLAGHQGPVTAWLQLDFWSEVQADADAASAACVAMLGAANAARRLDTLPIRWARCDGDRDGYEPYAQGSDAGVFRVGFDLRVCYCEGG
jgi:hypothetical protein